MQRHNLLNNPDLFRQVIGAPSFVQMFGAAEPLPRPQKPKKSQKKKAKNGDEDDDIKDKEQEPIPQPEPSRRRNVFGHEDELVNAPKGEATIPRKLTGLVLIHQRSRRCTKGPRAH